jgi:hypothetical protein
MMGKATARTASWPSSTPRLKEKRAAGVCAWGKPRSASAPAKPKPWISPKAKTIA